VKENKENCVKVKLNVQGKRYYFFKVCSIENRNNICVETERDMSS
jgi:hypothetical protein